VTQFPPNRATDGLDGTRFQYSPFDNASGWWWPEGLTPEPDQFADFAADIEIPHDPLTAWLAVTCGTWYSLWVNGKLLGHGPPRETAPWQYYDTVDLLTALKAGMNRIRIRACHLGVDTQFHGACMAGLMVVGEIAGGGWRIAPGKREYWHAAKSPAFLPGAPRLLECLGFGEHANLNESTDDWLHRPVDPSWPSPSIVARHPLPGRGKLIPSDLPAFAGEIRQAFCSGEIPGWQIWDFRGEVFGFLELKAEVDQPTTCTLLHGERLTMSGLPDHRFCGGDFREILELPAGIRYWKAFEKRALRYLALPSQVRVHRLAIRESHQPLKETWRDLPVVAELPARDVSILAAAARTVVLCCDDLLNDCPRRERSQYADPADYMGAMPLLFGTMEPIRRWLRQYVRGAGPDGVLRMCYPSPPGKTVIPDFSMAFPANLLRYFHLTGDKDTLHACYPAAHAGLSAFDRFSDPAGLLTDVPGWVFLCNSFELAKHPRSAALNALWSDGWLALGELARTLGDPGAERFLAKARHLREAWRKAFWHGGRILDCDISPDHEHRVWWNYHFEADRGFFADDASHRESFVIRFPVQGPARELTIAAPGRIRVWCDGKILLDETNSRPWTHPHPFNPWVCILPSCPAGELLIEVGRNPIDWEVYVAFDEGFPGAAMVGEAGTSWQNDPVALAEMADCPAEFRPWSAPVHNQITAGYCAGMLGPDEARRVLRECTREDFHVPWLKRTTPLVCTVTRNRELIAGRVVPCNTPHSLSFFCRQLARHGMQDEARHLCRRFFGVMMDAGSTTLWEEFAPRSSLCHAWGAFCAEYLLPASSAARRNTGAVPSVENFAPPAQSGLEHFKIL